jgi:hypothetical protein
MIHRFTFLLFTIAACSAPSDSRSVEISAHLERSDSLFGSIEVRGLSRSQLRSPDSNLVVQAVTTGDATPVLPSLAGRYVLDGGVLRFTPRYPPSGGLTLRVTVRSDSVIVREFVLPEAEVAQAATMVKGVYPSADTVPANLLRWYLEFSGPMREGEAEEHIRLLDGSGQVVHDALLLVSQELWDQSRTRLTVLFDPGRVKQGVRTNIEVGAPLVAGGWYTLVVDSGWRDGAGAPLASSHRKRFYVAPAARTPIDPDTWQFTTPKAGSREALVVRLDRTLDWPLAQRLISVVDQRGARVQGTVNVGRAEREWSFVPDEQWENQRYAIRWSPELEDPAGNRVGRVFDQELAEVEEPRANPKTSLGFRPAGLYILPPGPGSSVGRARD